MAMGSTGRRIKPRSSMSKPSVIFGPYRGTPPHLIQRVLPSDFEVALTDAGERLVRTYSGGMRRRLDLAGALVARPPVLFLDEPTTGLDLTSRLTLWDGIKALVSRGTTVLLTTQYLDEADHLSDRIAVIDHGRLIAEGAPDELKAQVGGDRLDIRLEDPSRCEEALTTLVGRGQRLGRRRHPPAAAPRASRRDRRGGAAPRRGGSRDRRHRRPAADARRCVPASHRPRRRGGRGGG